MLSLVIYLISFISLALWFFFKENPAIRSFFGKVFLASFLSYLATYFLGVSAQSTTAFAINLGFLFGGGLFLNTFSNNRFIFMVLLAMVIGGYYYTTIQDETPLTQIEKNLDPNAELLVEVANGHEMAEMAALVAKYGLTFEKAFVLESGEITDLDDYYAVNVPEAQMHALSDIMRDFRNTGLVDWVERNEQILLDPSESKSVTANSTNKKYGVNDPDLGKVWGFGAMQVDSLYKFLAEKKIKPARKARIAIIDTGVDALHEDLKDNYVSTRVEYDNDPNSHGTHCAGIAAAVSNNRKGIASFAPKNDFVEVTSIQVFGASGRTTQRRILNGMLLAADKKADVLSMSLGGPTSDHIQRAYKQAVDYANTKGAIVIVAAGNENIDARDRSPANVQGVITVSALDEQLNRASFSNHVSNVEMGIAAPGVNVYSSIPDQQYAFLSGTSMATPYVAGLVGMLKAIDPTLTTSQVYTILKSTGMATKNGQETGPLIYPLGAIQQIAK